MKELQITWSSWHAWFDSVSKRISACRKSVVIPRAEAESESLPASETEKSGNSFAALKDIEAIQEILPHRSGSLK